MDARYRSNFLLLAAAMQLLVLTLPVLAFAQDCTPSGIELTSQLEVDQFQANHGPCDRVSQNLVIRGEDITNFDGLSDLTSVLGDLVIDHNPSLITIDGLVNLQRVGSLIIWFNPSLLKIDGLSGLTRIDQDNGLHIRWNFALRSVSGLNELSFVENLFIGSNQFLTNLEGLSKLNQIGETLFIGHNSLLDLDAFSSLTSVGELTIDGEGFLTNLNGLSNLTDVKGDLYIYGNGLITIDGLSALARVGGDLWLLQNNHLSRCMGIKQLVDQIDDADPGPGTGLAPDVGGELLVEQNAIGCNSVEEILAEEPLLEMNAGLNDAWFNPGTDGQGFFVIVYPQIEQIFLAWFTYDIVRPPMDVTASVGEPGHRWLTAQGPFVGNRASLNLYNTSGGIFDSAEPAPTSQPYGNIVLEFSSCGRGTIKYDIHSIDWQSTVPIERIVLDNIPLCEALNSQ
jgi:hypothetical protein